LLIFYRDLRRVIGRVAAKGLGRQCISQAEALRLYHMPLEELGALADRRRQLAKETTYNGRGNEIVTYNVDRNVYGKFCAFYRVEKDDDSYVITFDEPAKLPPSPDFGATSWWKPSANITPDFSNWKNHDAFEHTFARLETICAPASPAGEFANVKMA
jgi:hypothetical protein